MVYVYSVLNSNYAKILYTHTDINGPALQQLENNFNKRVACGMLYIYYIDWAIHFFRTFHF